MAVSEASVGDKLLVRRCGWYLLAEVSSIVPPPLAKSLFRGSKVRVLFPPTKAKPSGVNRAVRLRDCYAHPEDVPYEVRVISDNFRGGPKRYRVLRPVSTDAWPGWVRQAMDFEAYDDALRFAAHLNAKEGESRVQG
jgi:hypothetical protein